MTTKEEIIKKINELDIEKIKLIGKLELLTEQEKASVKETKVEEVKE